MNKTFKKILSVCCTVVTTLTATLFRSTEVHAENTYKIAFIGDEQVGKTQLVKRIVENDFSDDYKYTIGVDSFAKETDKGDRIRLWDLAGQDRFRSLVQTYYQKADVLLYCCSCDTIDSQLQKSLEQSFDLPADSPVMLCITKAEEIHQSAQSDTNDFNQEKLQTILTQFRKANAGCNILSEILVTSAKNNQYKLCTPDNYDSTDYNDIHQNLAADLVDLCRSSADDHNEKSRIGYWLGIPASLVSLVSVVGLGYYGHDRYKKKKAVNHPTEKYIQHENKKIKRLLNN